MRTITLEEHFATPEFLKATAQLQSAARVDFVKAVESKLLDLGQGRIADMDAAGIDLQVLSLTWAGLDRLEGATATALAHDANDRLAAAVREHPKRFAGFAALALQEPEKAAAEFERCVRTLGFKGALVHGTTRGMFLDDPQFTPLFETAQALDVPITCTRRRHRNRCRRPISAGCRDSLVFSCHRGVGMARGSRDALAAANCQRTL